MLHAEPREEFGVVEVGLVLRSVGYWASALNGVPFDATRGVIPSVGGRVTSRAGGEIVKRSYVAGWVKRGPRGFIGFSQSLLQGDGVALAGGLPRGKTPVNRS